VATPVVSVLIPARNAARWLSGTLDSVLAQTWPALEVIVAEAGSTDDTRRVAEGFASRGVRLLPPGTAGSAPDNRNQALAAARGAYLFFLDADDLIAPDSIRALVEATAGDPEAVALGQWARFYAHPGEADFGPPVDWTELDPEEWLVREWTGGQPMMAVGTWLIPRSVAERAGPWNAWLTHLSDFDYFTRVLLASPAIRAAAGARLYYRSGLTGSLSHRESPAALLSAWTSVDAGTRALLERDSSPRARRACADLFQMLAFDAYIASPDLARRCEHRVAELGGSTARMGGGRLFRGLRRALGWRAAARVKHWCYRLGYDRVARVKERTLAAEPR
jgi:glycosyltransferase involved in cell wall biosynthesis